MAVGVSILLVFLATRERLSDEEQIRQILLQAERDANSKNATGLLSIVSKNYRDEQGFDYSAIRGLLAQWRRSSQKTDVTVYDLELQIQGKKASVSALVTVQFNSEARLELPLTAKLAKEKRTWKVVSASGWQGSSLGRDY